MDPWACALTRHAYISVYEQRFQDALALLALAGGIAAHTATAGCQPDTQLAVG